MTRRIRLTVVLALLLTLTVRLFAALPAADDFNRADTYSANDLGADWTIVAASLAIFSNSALGFGASTWPTAYWDVDSFNDDQYAEAVMGGFQFGSCGPAVRVSAGPNAYFLRNVPTFGWRIYENIAGTAAILLDKADGSAGVPVTGDTLRLEASGTTLSAYINGVFKGSVTDSSLTSGSGGFTCANDFSSINAWAGGNLGGVVSPPMRLLMGVGK